VRTEQLRREFGLNLRHTVFPLHPETPEQGMELAELFAGRDYDLDAMFARLNNVAAELGLPLGQRTHTYNSRRAQELGKWAEQLGKGDEFRAAVYHAYFAAGRDISSENELVSLAAELGLPETEARRVLQEQSFCAAVEADWQRARGLGVSAVPTVRYQDRLLVGFTPYDALRQLVCN
jgi:predicted DsbA family dithiol-disulfide isomerase